MNTMTCDLLKLGACIITGGLNKGVDQLIGNEVKRKRASEDNNLRAVLGICNWGCLEDKKSLLTVNEIDLPYYV